MGNGYDQDLDYFEDEQAYLAPGEFSRVCFPDEAYMQLLAQRLGGEKDQAEQAGRQFKSNFAILLHYEATSHTGFEVPVELAQPHIEVIKDRINQHFGQADFQVEELHITLSSRGHYLGVYSQTWTVAVTVS